MFRVLQAWELSNYIATTGSSDLVVLAGDLNVQPTDLEYLHSMFFLLAVFSLAVELK